MSFSDKQIEKLRAPLAREAVRVRKQAGRDLFYIEGWHAIAEANCIFGFDAWDRETVDLRMVSETPCQIGEAKKPGFRVAYVCRCRIVVYAGDRRIVREGTGYGSGIDADIGAAHESAAKEAETDAMKRGLMTFGNPFGLALYDKTQAEVAPAIRSPVDPPKTRKPHPRTAEAAAAKDRIKVAIMNAPDKKTIDDIIAVNAADLALIKDVQSSLYNSLMGLAQTRIEEFRLGA